MTACCSLMHTTPQPESASPPGDTVDVPQSWDELDAKLERRFRSLFKELEAMRARLQQANTHGRRLEAKLLADNGCDDRTIVSQ